VHTNRRIGCARATGDKTNAWTPREFALRFGHEGGPALLAANDKLDLLSVQVKAVQRSQVTFTRNTERMGNALGQKAFNKQVASNFGFHVGHFAQCLQGPVSRL
jgi:hypothetical protein